MASLPHRYLAGKLEPKKLAKELRELADWIDPSGVQQPVFKATAQEVSIFEFWQRAVGKPTARLTRDRQMKIRARLREGYSEEDIRKAIRNVAESGFHRGENEGGQEYLDLTLICRNGSKLEQYRDMNGGGIPEPKRTAAPSSKEERIAALGREATQALAEGKTDAYNQAQREIRRLRADGNDGL